MGGLGIYAGLLGAMMLMILVYKAYSLFSLFFPLLAGSLILLVIGIIDDAYGMQPPVKLFLQLSAALVTVIMGVRIEFFSLPFGGIIALPAFVGGSLTVLWIVGVTNTINLIDGVDGLAAGVSLIAGITLFTVAILLKRFDVALLASAFCGATFAFLKFNFSPASIFMGDTGSLLLGYMLACMSVLGVLKSAAALALAIPLLALGIPILDTIAAIVRRVKHRTHIFRADDQHLHHRLLRMGFTQKQVVWVIYYVSSMLSVAAVMLTTVSGAWAFIGLCAFAGLIYIGVRIIKRLELV